MYDGDKQDADNDLHGPVRFLDRRSCWTVSLHGVRMRCRRDADVSIEILDQTIDWATKAKIRRL